MDVVGSVATVRIQPFKTLKEEDMVKCEGDTAGARNAVSFFFFCFFFCKNTPSSCSCEKKGSHKALFNQRPTERNQPPHNSYHTLHRESGSTSRM